MNVLQDHVQALIAEACRYPAGTLQRQKQLNQIIPLIADHLWQERVPYYQDALQQTWVYFCQNLCESQTGNAYDPKKATVITWLNVYLKHRLRDGYRQTQKQRATTVPIALEGNRGDRPSLNLIERLPAQPDIPPLLLEIKSWAESDPDRTLTHTHLKNHPHITCQLLILKRLPPEAPWKDLSVELGVGVSTLSSFYQRKCMPLLREFGTLQGYL